MIPPKHLFFRHKVTKNASTMEFEQFCILGKENSQPRHEQHNC